MTHPSADPVASTRCYRHPQREAFVRCTRCERPICPDCMRPASVGFHCPDDVNEGRRTTRAPRTQVGARLLNSPPYVTIVIVAINVLLYLVTGVQARGGLDDPGAGPARLFVDWQLLPVFVYDGKYYELITGGFLHLSLLHIGSNMLALAVLGPPLESLLGRTRFTALYLISLLGGSAAVYAFGNELQPTVGASGAIFGLFGAALLMYRQLRLDPQYLIGVIVLNFILTFSISNISKLGHVGGFITGLLCALAIAGWPKRGQRVPSRIQAGGLGGVLVLLVLIIGLRTATW